MARKKDYTTVTEKAETAFEAKLESLPTQREKREVLEAAAELIPKKPRGVATVNGEPIAKIITAKPVEVKARPFGKKDKA